MGLTEKALHWLKKLKLSDLGLEKFEQQQAHPPNHDAWNEQLQQFVSKEGQVNYKAWLKERDALKNYLQSLSAHPPYKGWSKNQQLAYWINAYNAFTIDLILQHYPIKSIKAIGRKIQIPMLNSVWDWKFFEIGGIPYDLNMIEHQILRSEFQEPRIHFALNCASGSCPILRREAYNAEALEQQLEEQAKTFINDPKRNAISEGRISAIFNYYKKDFEEDAEDLHSYIARYSDGELASAQKLKYKTYDWSLNEKKN